MSNGFLLNSLHKKINSTLLPIIKPTQNVNIVEEIKPLKQCEFCFVICAYNVEKYIHNNLLSVINQNYPHWRIIYTNDASIDNTDILFWEIVKKYSIEDKVIYIKNEKQMRQSHNKYIAYQMVKDCEIVCILDGDDWLNGNDVLDKFNREYMF